MQLNLDAAARQEEQAILHRCATSTMLVDAFRQGA